MQTIINQSQELKLIDSASGLEAVILLQTNSGGQSDLTIGGGVESMSRVPMGSAGGLDDDPQ